MMSDLLEFKSFCFCLSLRTGNIITGALFLVLGVLHFIFEMHTAISFYHFYKETEKYASEVVFTEELEPTITMCFGIVLIYGVIKENVLLIFSCVVYSMVLISRNCLFLTIIFVLALSHGFSHPPNNIEQIVEVAIHTGFYFFFLLCIRSYAIELSKRRNGRLFERISGVPSDNISQDNDFP